MFTIPRKMPWTEEVLHQIKTTKEVTFLACEVFSDEDIAPLAEAIVNNPDLLLLDLSLTNFIDEWFSILSNKLLVKPEIWREKLTIILDNTDLTNKSLEILKKIKKNIGNLIVSRGEEISEKELNKISSVPKDSDSGSDLNSFLKEKKRNKVSGSVFELGMF